MAYLIDQWMGFLRKSSGSTPKMLRRTKSIHLMYPPVSSNVLHTTIYSWENHQTKWRFKWNSSYRCFFPAMTEKYYWDDDIPNWMQKYKCAKPPTRFSSGIFQPRLMTQMNLTSWIQQHLLATVEAYGPALDIEPRDGHGALLLQTRSFIICSYWKNAHI